MTGIKTTNRPLHTATDGKEFTDIDEAKAHQVGLDVTEEAERYAAQLRTSAGGENTAVLSERAQRAEVNRILRWERWKAAQPIDAVSTRETPDKVA